MTSKLFKKFYLLGEYFTESEAFNPKIVKKLVPFEHLTRGRIFFMKLMRKAGAANIYWDQQLKNNDAFEMSFDRPIITE